RSDDGRWRGCVQARLERIQNGKIGRTAAGAPGEGILCRASEVHVVAGADSNSAADRWGSKGIEGADESAAAKICGIRDAAPAQSSGIDFSDKKLRYAWRRFR